MGFTRAFEDDDNAVAAVHRQVHRADRAFRHGQSRVYRYPPLCSSCGNVEDANTLQGRKYIAFCNIVGI